MFFQELKTEMQDLEERLTAGHQDGHGEDQAQPAQVATSGVAFSAIKMETHGMSIDLELESDDEGDKGTEYYPEPCNRFCDLNPEILYCLKNQVPSYSQ